MDPTMYNQLEMSEGPLGTCGSNITRRLFGCYVTSQAMMATDMGHRITPDQLNDEFLNRGLYVNGCDGRDGAIHEVFSDINLVRRSDSPNTSADLDMLRTQPNESCILQLDGNALHLGFATHYCYLVWYDGHQVGWNNPFGGVRQYVSSDDAARLITAIIKYSHSEPVSNRVPFQDVDDTRTGVQIAGKLLVESPFLNWADLQQVGQSCARGTGVTYTEAKKVGGKWFDRILTNFGPGAWALADEDVDTRESGITSPDQLPRS